MILLDSLLVGGIKFVLDKVAQAVDQQLDDADVLRQRLLEAQMRCELGEISEEELAEVEKDLLARLRTEPIELKGKRAIVEASFEADEEH
jgi:hypothetical protein